MYIYICIYIYIHIYINVRRAYSAARFAQWIADERSVRRSSDRASLARACTRRKRRPERGKELIYRVYLNPVYIICICIYIYININICIHI